MGVDPAQGRPRIVDRGREGVLGSQSVIHRDDGRPAVHAQAAAHVVVAVEIAEHVAAAVEVHDPGLLAVACLGPVQAQRGNPRSRLDVAYRAGSRRDVGGGEDLPVQIATGSGREVGEVGRAAGRRARDEGVQLMVECMHVRLPHT